MSPNLVALIILSVSLSSGSQVALKRGMLATNVQDALQGGNIQAIILSIVTSPFVLGGLFGFGLSVLVWLFVLSKVPLSIAYPFVALGIGVTVIAGVMLFGESISPTGAIGVGLILLGIFLVAAQ